MTSADAALSSYPDALPVGTALGEFAISKVIGVGGFGIVYTAHDAMLDRTVAIKEYFPVTIAGRANVDNTVLVRALHNQDAYSAGVQSFLQEARLQARFSHPAMLEVYRVWEQNATAYMAMRYYPGSSLRSLRLDPASALIFDEAAIRQVTSPIFDALQLLHSRSVLHRDVSPDNILMLPSGAPVLLDFGAARSVEAGAPQSLTTVLKPGYAPIEQYADDGAMEQGPWTDVYALGAVLHFLAVGTPPSQAVTRIMGGTLKTFEDGAADRFSDAFIAAVKAALEVHGRDRVQSVAAFREALGWTNSELDERPVSMLLTTDSFPSQVPHTATKTAKAPNATKTVKTAKSAPTATQKSSKKTTSTADDSTQVLSPAAIRQILTQLPGPVTEAAAVPSAKSKPRPTASDVVARPTVKAQPKAAALKDAAEPLTRAAEWPKAPAQQSPRRFRTATVAISAGAVLALAITIYMVNARKLLRPPVTEVAPQISTPSATSDALVPAVGTPTPTESKSSPEGVKNSLEIKADAAPQAASVGVDSESKSSTASTVAPARATAAATTRLTQAQRGSERNIEKPIAANPVQDAVEKLPPLPKARAAASERTAPEMCGQILAKLSLGGADITDSERNQLRGCK